VFVAVVVVVVVCVVFSNIAAAVHDNALSTDSLLSASRMIESETGQKPP